MQQGLIGGSCTDLRIKHGHLPSYSEIPKGSMTRFVRNAYGTNVGDLEEAVCLIARVYTHSSIYIPMYDYVYITVLSTYI